MKLLLDACVWGKAREALEAAGHDAVWAGEREEDPGEDLQRGAIVTAEPGRFRVPPPDEAF